VSVAQACDAAWRIVIVGCGAMWRNKGSRQRDAEEACEFERVFSHLEISPET
jgi:hypothetical protein